jgi:protoporphyrinogen oxidase
MSGPVIVLGAGLAGLSAAHHFPGECEIFEKEPYPGGHSRTKHDSGFAFDEGAHVFFGDDECSRDFVHQPLGAEMVAQEAEIWNNYGGDRYGRYPVQVNAHALPPELASRCLLDFIAADREPVREVRTYEEWCHASFGRAFADNFMLRYARKVWTVEPSELNVEWLGSKVGGRVARPSLEQVVRGALEPGPHVFNYLTKFSYPRRGGFGRIVDPLASLVKNVNLGCAVVEIEAEARRIRFADGRERRYQAAISTIPLPALVRLAKDAPSEVRSAAEALMWTSVRCVNLGIARPEIGPGHWCYFYDHDVPFFRISFPSKLSPGNAPPGMSSVSCEIAYSRRKPLREEGLVEAVLASLRGTGILGSKDRVVFQDQVDIPFAYVVYDARREPSLKTIHSWMESRGLHPCGRFGEWGYHWSFEAMESGRRVAQRVARAGRA